MLVRNEDASDGVRNHAELEPPTTRTASSRMRHRPVAILLLALPWFAPISADAQSSDSFDVSVVPESAQPPPQQGLSQSQRQVTAQGSAALASSTLQLRSLKLLSESLRREQRRQRLEDEEDSETSAGNSLPLSPAAGLGAAWLSGSAVAGSTLDAETGAEFDRFNVFGSADYRASEQDRTVNAPANESDMLGLVLGADYRVNPDLVLGATVGYVANETDFTSGNFGQLEHYNYSISALASWYVWQNLYVDAVGRIAALEFDAIRQVAGGGIALGDTTGFEYAISTSSGYEFHRGPLSFGPQVRVTYIDLFLDGYMEAGGGNPLRYGNQDVESLRTAVGGNATYAINTGFGVVVPQAAVEWVHEFDDDPRLVTAQSIASGAFLTVPVDARDSDFYRISVGASAVLTHGRNLFFRYEADLSRENRENHTITLGARLEL
ncbi:autotransporter outer membrane beta-barrel domain-containing protein [Salinisphaera sp. P385]|uniref:Autotransporter outer membrane beta-barrel domain-containing protein n=1 Tax=Spectribacter acetivorans TaxID=3075603 RepID=A0ABU3B8L2_9GAMM|nr:autotransporter outer membrane beta-barrel domain-containing protein [Salinisphaera sp. P385]MDT0618801.1 autotransporter outer membrane beta-barrel domain-containing protein [Salinisphaera sp. P385]